MREWDDIVRIIQQRQQDRSPLVGKMMEVQARYNGDWVIPLPDMEGEPTLPPVTPFLIAGAIDHSADRATSVKPDFEFPAIDPAKDTGKRSMAYADVRRRAFAATLYESNFNLVESRWFRHLGAYAEGSLLVTWDPDRQYPCIEIRDPLASLPEPKAPEDTSPPANCAFLYELSADEVRRQHPKARNEAGGIVGFSGRDMTELWTLAEWVDEDQTVIGIVGPKYGVNGARTYKPNQDNVPWMMLTRQRNRAGRCTALANHTVGLDKVASQVANAVGMTDLMAKLMALDIVAQEKAIFPDKYVIGGRGRRPRVVGGTWHDGRDGQINVVEDADSIGELRSTPDLRTTQMIDRLDQAFRESTGLTDPMTGSGAPNLRGGRALDTFMGIAVDKRIATLHRLAETVYPHLADLCFAVYEGWRPSTRYVMFSGWHGDKGHVEFVPMTHLAESHKMVASYAIAGMDAQQTTVGLGQLLGTKLISRDSARRRHPYIDDPEGEARRIDAEEMEDFVKAALGQQAIQGQVPATFLAAVHRYRKQGKTIFEAVEEADAELRAKQATPAPPAPEGMMAPPEAMPGMMGGPQAMQQAMPPQQPPQPLPAQIPGPNQDQENLRNMFAALAAGGR